MRRALVAERGGVPEDSGLSRWRGSRDDGLRCCLALEVILNYIIWNVLILIRKVNISEL
jgi:hypothetical protein